MWGGASLRETVQALGFEPAEEEVAQYRSDCIADVCERAELTREQACLDTDGAQCATFFQCLQEIDTATDDDVEDDA